MSRMTLSAIETLEMAQQVERNGASFYRFGANMNLPLEAKRLLLELAGWEDQHEKTFADMEADLIGSNPQESTIDPQAMEYMQALVKGRIFDINAQELAARCKGLPDVLTLAVELEKNSIMFYLGLKAALNEPAAKAKIDAVIREEMRHVVILHRELEVLGM